MAALLPSHDLDIATRALIDQFQRDFPLLNRPFAEIGRHIGLSEAETLRRLADLVACGAVTRIGAVVRPHAAGASTLAAVAAPAGQLEEIAARINACAGVNHNYERENAYNLWFVVTGRTQDDVERSLADIEQATGLPVLNLPLETSYHIDLGFSLFGARGDKPLSRPLTGKADGQDKRVLAAIEAGLPLVEQPFAEVAGRLGMREADVIHRIDAMVLKGIISRFGVVVRHRAFGYTANAMAVWDIDDGKVDEIGARFAAHAGVTLCYRRPRRLPHWRYNLFTMVHGTHRAAAEATIARLAEIAAPHLAGRDVLFSLRCFKQRGAVFSATREDAA